VEHENVKMTIVAKDGVARIGNDFHVLEDRSLAEFITNDIEAFKSFLKGEFNLFYNGEIVQAYAPVMATQNTKPLATLALAETDAMEYFTSVLGRNFDESQFELVLLGLRPFMKQEGLALLSNVRDFKITKVSEFQRKKDNAGNFVFSYARKSAGNNDFVPPQFLNFSIPIFENMPDRYEAKAEFLFDYTEVKLGDGIAIKLMFQLRILQFTDELKERKNEILEAALQSFKQPKFRGEYKLHSQTDAWKYKQNVFGR
jgi:hypothetical protein